MRKRQVHWARLETLLSACGRRGVRALDHRELQELALLYRQTAADLSTARADPTSAALAQYLNALLGRAHNHLYAGRSGGLRAVLRFYASDFPRLVRANAVAIGAALGVFLFGGLVGLLLSIADPGFDRFLLGGDMIDTIERKEMWTHEVLAMKPLASSALMRNNIAVSLAACASGIAGGLGTLYMMTFNGLLIGVIGAACFRAGMSVSLWSFVAPHGALELPAIFLAGGAGFVLAQGILFPGLRSRRDALMAAGGQAIRLLFGVVPMLVIAGIIEAYISPTPMAPSLKFLLGGGLFTLLCLYLASAGRRPPVTADSAP